MADMPPVQDIEMSWPSEVGMVKFYLSKDNPEVLDITSMQPTMTAEAPLSDTIQPVLEALADNYSPVQGL
jgi:hypothetical protein